MQEVDTNSSSPHPPAARAPTPPRVCKKSRDVEGEGRKTCTESLECREEEKDLKDVHLGGYKQTQTQHSDKKGQRSKISIQLFHHDA